MEGGGTRVHVIVTCGGVRDWLVLGRCYWVCGLIKERNNGDLDIIGPTFFNEKKKSLVASIL